MKNIFVGNLAFSVTESTVRALFEAYGAVDRVSLVTDRETGKARGFGFVEMPNDSEAERAIEAVVPEENIVCRVPMFIGAAVMAKHTDAIATLPNTIATVLAADLDLDIITPPVKLPRIEISQYWHDRLHREPGSKWIRTQFTRMFKNGNQ